MLDSDISTNGALAHLSASEEAFPDAHALDRRRFLQLIGMGIGAGLVAGPGTSLLDSVLCDGHNAAWAAGPIGATDGILVIIGMFGGNDGLNTVVPINDGRYYDQHRALAVPANQALPLDAATGLHPELTALKEFWDRGQLAVVEGIGYPDADLSHFNSMAKWMAGKPTGIPTSGWVGRWLDGHLGGAKDLFVAAEIGHSLPLHMIGESSRATAIPASRPSFGAGTEARDLRQYQAIRNLNTTALPFWQQQVSQAFVDQLDVSRTIAPSIPEVLSDIDLVARLEVSARLINANLGFRVLTAGWGDFDSHAGQPNQHPVRMRELNEAIRRFFEVLHPDWASRVTVMTFSEFGRTSYSNDGAGTDHGTSAPHFVFGSNVKGGRYGQRPSLAGLGRWDRMAHHVDFRDYYGSVIDGWMGGGGSTVLGKTIVDLGLFASAPGAPTPGGGTSTGGGTPPVIPPTAVGDFMPISPVRLVDTREGVGAPLQKIGPQGTIDVATAGVAGLPTSGMLAVVVNVTATQTDSDTFLTVYPRGITRPLAASLNPSPARDTGNLVVVGVDTAGMFTVYNNVGTTHCVVDIAGYFTSSPGSRLHPIVPSRLLDTRFGNGAAQARVQGGQTIDVAVAGRGGVPESGVQAVIVNVVAVNPSTGGYVVVHPHGEAAPLASSLNYLNGQDIGNLVMCKVGASGKISMYASTGDLDVVADVVGYYAAAGVCHVPVTPVRVLDTRYGNGAPTARVGADAEIALRVAGRGGVPANASAVVMNVTAVNSSDGGYVTVYPDGVTRPETASLNVGPGGTVPNLVVTKVGTDGNVRLFNKVGTVDLVADVSGYFI